MIQEYIEEIDTPGGKNATIRAEPPSLTMVLAEGLPGAER
jgi:hypothetical protein